MDIQRNFVQNYFVDWIGFFLFIAKKLHNFFVILQYLIFALFLPNRSTSAYPKNYFKSNNLYLYARIRPIRLAPPRLKNGRSDSLDAGLGPGRDGPGRLHQRHAQLAQVQEEGQRPGRVEGGSFY